MHLDIRPVGFAELATARNVGDLVAEYAQESSIPGFGEIDPQWSTYEAMEGIGLAHCIGAFLDGELVGGVIVLINVVPHYGRLAACTESIFVAQHARRTGAGMLLLRAAEKLASERGAAGIFVSAPEAGQLAKVLPGVGYIPTNRVFFRSLPHV